MKNLIMFFVCVLFFFNQIKAQSYGLNNADPSVFTKYKIPDTDLHSLWFNTNLNYNSTKNTFYILNDNSFHFNEQLDYTLSPQYYLLNQSDDKTFSLMANLTGSYHYSRNVIDEPIYYNNFHSKNTEANILLALNFNYAKYINTSDLFYNFGSNVNVTMYNYQTDDSIINNDQNNFNYKVQNYTLSAGIGWGRMRNVTPVVSAIRFQERLKQVNALDKDLDENTIEDLAQKFSQVNYYSEVYNRADKFFWKDVENILSKDGVTLNGLNQYSDSYLREVLDEVRFIRTEGFETSLNFQLNYNNSYYSNSAIYEQLYTILNGSLLYSHQLNLNSQLSFNLSVSGGPNLTAHTDTRQEYYLNTGLEYDYELTDRLVASINDYYFLTFQNTEIQSKTLNNVLSFVFHYFVEDNVSIAASYTWNYADSKNYSNIMAESENNYNNVSIGINYYIDRGIIVH